MIGVYPGAALASWDVGGQTLADVLSGIATAIQQPGTGVINLSVGFEGGAGSDLLKLGIDSAFAAGWLVVAAAGNGGGSGSPPTYPADLPHVLTVGATDQNGNVASFSSRSRSVDLAAPGVNVLAAVPTWKDPSGFASLTGTSFSAPIVSGAASWLWTVRSSLDNTQISELLRRSATDIDARGFDISSGWGLLNIPAALAMQAPIRDPQEPNDDIVLVSGDGIFGGTQPLVDATLPRTHVAARLDPAEDPADVYRVYIPKGRQFVASVEHGTGVQLTLWGPRTQSIRERKKLQLRDLVDTGKSVQTYSLTRKGAYYYLAATLAPGVPETQYLLSVALRVRQ